MERILDVVRESAAREGITRVRTVALVVGPRSGAMPEALRFAFEVLAGTAGPGGTQTAVGPPATDSAAIESPGPPGRSGAGRGPAGLFAEAVLLIDVPPIRARCRRCGTRYGEGDENGPDWAFTCPACGSSGPEFLSGNELRLDYYEGD